MNFRQPLTQYKGLPKEIYILGICTVINSVGSFVVPLLTLIMTQKIGFSKEEAGTFVTLLVMTQGPCLLLGGKLVDTFGRMKIIVIFQTLGSLFYIACGFVNPGFSMAIFILIASDLYIIASPAFNAIIADITTDKNRKQAFSILYIGGNLGFAIGPVLGGILINKNLPLLFIGDALTTLASMLLLAIFIKDTKINLDKTHSDGPINEKNSTEKLSMLGVLFKLPVLLSFSIIMMLFTFSYSQWSFALPLQMGDFYKSNGAHIYSYLMCLNSIVVIFGTPIISHIIHKLHTLKAIAVGGVFYFLAFSMFALFQNFYLYFISVFVMTIGKIIISINDNTFIADNSPETHRGRVNSFSFLIKGFSYGIGPIVMGKIITLFDYKAAWGIISAIMLTGVISMAVLYKITSLKLKTKLESEVNINEDI